MKDIRGCLSFDLVSRDIVSFINKVFIFMPNCLSNGLLVISQQLGKIWRGPELIWFCIWQECFTLIRQKSSTAWPTKTLGDFNQENYQHTFTFYSFPSTILHLYTSKHGVILVHEIILRLKNERCQNYVLQHVSKFSDLIKIRRNNIFFAQKPHKY